MSGSSSGSTSTISEIRSIIAEITIYTLVASIIGCAFTCLTFLVFKEIRTYPIKLICYLCVCISLGYTGVNIQDQDWISANNGVCITIAVGVHYFLLANFAWTSAIAYNFYQMIVKRNREAQKLEKWYHLICWGLPAIVVTIVGSIGEYGYTGAVCYIENAWVTYGTLFVPGLVAISINSILFFLIGREIAETLAGAPKTDQRDRKQEFRVYISIFISLGLSWVFGYIEVLISSQGAKLFFFIIFNIMTPAQGILIFLFYCVNAKVALKWTALLGRVIPCCNMINAKIQRSTSSTSRGSSSASSSRGMDSATSSRTSAGY
eukprot:TRINITY_DN3364_c0_g1_i2.p1 TRINITY_DN3364_c0_g1~~TRINITY_DN3364_c0_g1_i2.p1  ORF type:complete len:320 (+),score=35.11 TRINITY_DN3364_c0_g1_i2:197-1156(+)